MNSKLFVMILKSIARRRKQVLRVMASVFFSFVFITGILLFQENMYRWQVASAKEHFGDWFVMSTAGRNSAKPEVADHPYLDKGVFATTGECVYNASWIETEYLIGTMSDAFLSQGNITLNSGRMPANDDEIVMDWNTLLKMNYSAELGSSISIRTYKGAVSREENRIEKEYTLVGILNSYTNIWQGGSKLPGVILSEHEFEAITETMTDVYIYPLKSYIKTDNFEEIYKNMKENFDKRLVYNSSVYNDEPWESPLVYNYLYLLVMLIGIAAITYQVIGYQRSRQAYLEKLNKLGAEKGQLRIVTLVENSVILVIAGLLGFLVAVGLGKVLCCVIESSKGVTFYEMSMTVVLKTLLSMIIAIVVEEVVGLLMFRKGSSRKNTHRASGKKVSGHNAPDQAEHGQGMVLTSDNYVKETHKRLMCSNGRFLNIAVRIFSLAMAGIMIVCVINICSAYTGYQSNNEQIDLVGFLKEADATAYRINYITDHKKISEWEGESILNQVSGNYQRLQQFSTKSFTPEEWGTAQNERYDEEKESNAGVQIKSWNRYGINTYIMTKGIKCGDSSLSYGLTPSDLAHLQSIPGVQDVNYSYYETERNWMWDDMDYEQMGVEKYLDSKDNATKKNAKYLYATEYVNPTKELYEILSPYIDKDLISYEAFASGEQVLVIEAGNSDGGYDTSMHSGVTLKLMNYDSPFYQFENRAGIGNWNSYYSRIFDYAKKYMLNEDQQGVTFTKGQGLSNSIGTLAYHYLTRNLSNDDMDELYGSRITGNQKNTDLWYEEMRKYRAVYTNVQDMYTFEFAPAATTKVAGVVHLTDDLKEQLKDYVCEYGQYTAIASEQLGQRAIDSQNALFAEKLLLEEIPEEIALTMQYNQVAVRYDLSSTFASTGNIVGSYLGQAGFSYQSYSDAKDQLKAKTVEAILLYGITMLAAIVIDLIIGVLFVKNRLDRRRRRFEILVRTGADSSDLIKICMLESVREALWCIFIAPAVLLIHYLIYRKFIRKL